jgi:hypothetical protein
MTSAFQVNLVEFGDTVGWGVWQDDHYRQHLNYNAALAARTPPIIVSAYPILVMGDTNTEMRFWLDAHNTWHEIIRQYTNVTGVDLSEVNLKNPSEFYSWIDLHNQEHQIFDQQLGLA